MGWYRARVLWPSGREISFNGHLFRSLSASGGKEMTESTVMMQERCGSYDGNRSMGHEMASTRRQGRRGNALAESKLFR
ncbi:hypothetical protein HPP92_011198 [Vanilla planifolia]|uniref:Uncharacterized protein n=1 Tax=Vanilla planifolia TaxID=51239 RepID=A0A835V0T1_VANPL|nr:hypothetical protein HPP92_011198 [Vanilla planifolia]